MKTIFTLILIKTFIISNLAIAQESVFNFGDKSTTAKSATQELQGNTQYTANPTSISIDSPKGNQNEIDNSNASVDSGTSGNGTTTSLGNAMTFQNGQTYMTNKILVKCMVMADQAARFPSVVVDSKLFGSSAGLKQAYRFCDGKGQSKISVVTVEDTMTISTLKSGKSLQSGILSLQN